MSISLLRSKFLCLINHEEAQNASVKILTHRKHERKVLAKGIMIVKISSELGISFSFKTSSARLVADRKALLSSIYHRLTTLPMIPPFSGPTHNGACSWKLALEKPRRTVHRNNHHLNALWDNISANVHIFW
ncbi:unnamed protein product [Cyclocybe aegerita]|uniref:Uncharacterized protein n=1 Tax=Cyclocybe aegerita TaxID=1973307 RepID=A0A8S0WPJ3_CYCAE|nr:unnamed protein product [Cyclocybe aegerita]